MPVSFLSRKACATSTYSDTTTRAGTSGLRSSSKAPARTLTATAPVSTPYVARIADLRFPEGDYDRMELLGELEAEMLKAAEELDFEKAAALRDHIAELKKSQAQRVPAAGARPSVEARQRTGPRSAEEWQPHGQRRRPAGRRR